MRRSVPQTRVGVWAADSTGGGSRTPSTPSPARRQRYEPGAALAFDEEDIRTGAGAAHANTPTRLTYGPTGRVMEVALNDAGRSLTTRYEYDVKGNVTAVVEADGRRSTFTYDLLGHRIRTESPSSGVTTFVFDANGNLLRRKDARGEVVDYAYDELDRLRRVSFPATGAVTTEYIYHDTTPPAPPEAGLFTKGRLVKVVHQGGQEVFAYDALGQVNRKDVTGPGLPGGGIRFDYTYRADGKRNTITYPAHSAGAARIQVNYEYDSRGLLQRMPNYVRKIDYNLAGQRTRVEYANDVVTTYTYDPLTMRLTDILTVDPSGATLQQFNHAYDLTGNLLAVGSPDPESAMTYGYDDLYRLVQAARGAGETWTYEYDDVGNLTTKSDVGAFSYDAAGQAITGPWGQTDFDSTGRLRTITNGAEQTTGSYDHDGRRVRMQIAGGATAVDILTPDDLLTIENGVFLASILDGPSRVAQVRLDTGAVGFLHGDHLGSTTLVTGPTGAVVQRIRYDPFGAVLANTIAPGAEGTRHLYTGAELDARSGLLYLRARYYHPKFGRFLTPDTLVPDLHEPQAWNRYSYVQNNPLRYVDPTGHFWEEIGDWFEENWKAVVAVVAIIAIVVLTIVTFGAAGLIAVGIGMAIGGAIGGDILLGILVGMAVGGAAAFAALGIAAGMAAAFGAGTLAATLLTGTLSGAVTGAAMGFAAGFAGGMGNAATIWDRMWKGALVGAITGLAFSRLSYYFQHNPFGPKMPTSWSEVKQGALEAGPGMAKSFGQEGTMGGGLGGALTGSQNTGAYWLSPLLGGGSVLGSSTVTAWQLTAIGLTSVTSGVFVLDWADDLLKWLGVQSYERGGI
jgi:RHS repeat-associated protein